MSYISPLPILPSDPRLWFFIFVLLAPACAVVALVNHRSSDGKNSRLLLTGAALYLGLWVLWLLQAAVVSIVPNEMDAFKQPVRWTDPKWVAEQERRRNLQRPTLK
jgi:hypothetical protein